MKHVNCRTVLAGISVTLSLSAFADVTMEQTLDVTAPGALSLAAMEGKTTMAIAGNRSRTDNDLKFKSSIMQRFSGNTGQTSEIVRLEEGVVVQLDHKERQYQQTTFAALQAQMDQAVEQIEQSRSNSDTEGSEGSGGSTDLPVDEQSCEWSTADVNVSKTGTRQKIAGVEAEETRVTSTQTCVNPDSGKACDLTWTMESWLAPDVPGGAESAEFSRAYAQKLGYGELAGNPGLPGMAALFSQYESGWEEIEKHSAELDGYPLRTIMSLAIGGEECTTTDGEPLSYEAVYGESMQEALGESAAASLGETVGGGIGGAVAKSLFGAFGKKKEPEPAAAPATTASGVTLFRIQMETTSIDTSPVPDERFEVPAGYSEVSAAP